MTPLTLRSGLCIFGLAMAIGPADAAVYCKYAGVPKGCVARPGAMIAPGPRVARHGAVVARPRGGANLGGPVNRIGPR
ncbi:MULTISPECIES: hypothetical protein [Methylosinus]|uniref:DUF3551 domain-containing protein n=1 Tax=Methylosinus trichosporium (strain ATCC 35070 / NCIMB 11131 / UNIQEM 75 / OB3b) TaxID=595536 RepID=A0A2D2D3Q8_METT3|nr:MULTISPECIES: hypothetical protein [Methylosinus]ATQ69614.1 hypothetical protein CQW49_18280 [Methylosinus trichosporium OB3b]